MEVLIRRFRAGQDEAKLRIEIACPDGTDQFRSARYSSVYLTLLFPNNAVSESSYKRLILALKLLLVAAILSYLFYDVSQNGQWDRLVTGSKRWGWVGLGWVACMVAHLLGFLRWQRMVRALGLPFGVLDSIRIGLIGLFFGLFTFGVVGGDTLRAYYVTRQVKNRTPEAITSVLADRLIGILTMFMIASIAFLMLDTSLLDGSHEQQAEELRLVGWVVVCCTGLGIAGLVFLFLTPKLAGTQLYYRTVATPRIGPLIAKVTEVVKLYRQRRGAIASAFLFSVGVNLSFAVSIYALAVGLSNDTPTFSNHFIIEPIAMVSNAVPVPGGIGAMEVAMKYLYLAFGSESGVIIGFAFRFTLLSVSALGAAVWFWNRDQVATLETVETLQPSGTDRTT